MIKIFVTGDNHIGKKYSNHPNKKALIEARISAFDGMVRVANSEECNLFVITGDLFESTSGINKKDVKAIIEKLSSFNGTVAVLPGNHDYFAEGVKVWQDFCEIVKTKDNITLLSDFKPYELTVDDEEVVLYPALCKSKHSNPGENNLGWIKKLNIVPDSTYRIGIAHGAVEGESMDSEGAYFLMSRKELEDIPVDVWLIGHTHVPFPRSLEVDDYTSAGKIFNAGTHVQTDEACYTEGYCFIITIDNKKNVRAKKVISGGLRFYNKKITLKGGEMQDILQRELAPLGDNSVVELELSGAVTAEEYEDRRSIIENLLKRFLEGNFNDTDLVRILSEKTINAEFSETSFSAKLLTELIADQKEAQLMYDLLKSLKGGK